VEASIEEKVKSEREEWDLKAETGDWKKVKVKVKVWSGSEL
jgi:hypothetical protein